MTSYRNQHFRSNPVAFSILDAANVIIAIGDKRVRIFFIYFIEKASNLQKSARINLLRLLKLLLIKNSWSYMLISRHTSSHLHVYFYLCVDNVTPFTQISSWLTEKNACKNRSMTLNFTTTGIFYLQLYRFEHARNHEVVRVSQPVWL